MFKPRQPWKRQVALPCVEGVLPSRLKKRAIFREHSAGMNSPVLALSDHLKERKRS